MKIAEEKIIHAPPEKVFAALNDVAVLRRCIPGCESLEKTSDAEMKARAAVKIGSMTARFSGTVLLSDVTSQGYTISGQGDGAAGFAKGEAKVRIAPHPHGTALSYEATASVGGKIAQIGSRLVDSVARKLAAQFFESFAAEVGDAPAAPEHQVGDSFSSVKGKVIAFALAASVLFAAAYLFGWTE